ncbi:coproporphyrinogen III oxidase [candidate division KSB1 bacterium]|nr:MAG: coproporphyrinogen III oxidase [candidate division KSB1 bacterium]
MADAGLYIHIPFCEKRCLYCDFYTIAGSRNRIPDYIAALQREIALRAAEKFWQRQKFATIFFGGGTPSLLSSQQIATILDCCFAHFKFNEVLEVTLEANPGTIDGKQMANYRAVGINRLSLGVQSFEANELKLLDRVHSPQQARLAAQHARYAGFENLNLDFMFALPSQTRRRWQRTLQRAVALNPDHISAYNLTHGYRHYEISNFAKPGYEAQHNIKYWDGSAYLGLGASAHSFDGKRRFWNVANLRKYLDRLAENQLPEDGSEELTRQQRMFEFAFLGLRQRRGIPLAEFARKFKQPFEQVFNGEIVKMEAQGLLVREADYFSERRNLPT